MSKTTLDLSTLSGISDGTHTVKVKAKADGYSDSEFSNEVSYTKSTGGDGIASTTAKSGVTYTDGLSGIDAATVSIFAQAISNNSAITSSTSTVYIDYGDVHRKVSVGDQVALSLNGTSYNFDVIGFNHDTLTTPTAYGAATATGKAGITFQMHGLFATNYPMNSSDTNEGSWKSSVMRTSTMVTMKGYLPSAWQTAIKSVNKATGLGGGFKEGTETTSDDCFLLAEIEVFGSVTYSVADEGTQYQYYITEYVSEKYDESGARKPWWERSPYWGKSNSFCCVGAPGTAYNYKASSLLFFTCFAFCV